LLLRERREGEYSLSASGGWVTAGALVANGQLAVPKYPMISSCGAGGILISLQISEINLIC